MMPTYSLAKIAAEVVARTGARQFNLPTVITRLNVPYGDNGGWMGWHLEAMIAGYPIQLHSDRPNLFNPIHEDDIIARLPALLGAASVPATILNWGGDEQVSLYVPAGCAHGFQALTEPADVTYRIDRPHDPSEDVSIAFDDPELAIPWPLPVTSMSARDKKAPSLAEAKAILA